jgi:transposase InsO family protein
MNPQLCGHFRGRFAAVEPEPNRVLFKGHVKLLSGPLGENHGCIHTGIIFHCLSLPVSVFSRRPKVWLGDITYIATDEGWLYLAGILDLYSRRLTGWAMSEHIDTQLILTACPRWR